MRTVLSLVLLGFGFSQGFVYADDARVVCIDDCAALIGENLVAGDPGQGAANTRRMAALMAEMPDGGAVRFPSGDYYFTGSANPGHGSIETTAPGQTITGDGPGLTRIIQTDARRDFGFQTQDGLKRVPSATIRLQHKGCALRDLSVVVDPAAQAGTIMGTAAIQVAHLAYREDGQPLIVETTGVGADYLIDHVTVSRVDVGENLGSGIQSSRFFEVGVDIIGSGGHVRVREMDRLDARIGIRLDNGNHCGQGEYTFEDIHMIGRHGVTDGGVFFDWVGGQAPLVRHCSASFINGFRAGPLGLNGDRLEPFPEGEVHRASDRDWDWLTWHGHPVAAEPNAGERTAWYGLPRQARVVRAGSLPRTGGTAWREGRDFTQERIGEDGPLAGATRIHWLSDNRPAPGAVYYVTFEQPKAFRVHDLQWGLLDDFSSQEAAQQRGAETYAMKFEDQGVGVENPDFGFPVGFGVTVSKSFILNGDIVLRGRVQYMQWSDNTAGVCTVRVAGLGPSRRVKDVRFSQGKHGAFALGDHIEAFTLENCTLWGGVTLDAPNYADGIAVSGNEIRAFGGAAIRLEGEGLRGVRVSGNRISSGSGDGIVCTSAENAVISGNVVEGLSGTGILLEGAQRLVLTGNTVTDSDRGIHLQSAEGSRGTVTGNLAEGNASSNWTADPAPGPEGLAISGNVRE